MDIQPTGDKLLVLADAAKEKTDSGIILQEDWKTLPLWGEVLAVGPKVHNIKRGERILFMRYASLILDNDRRLIKEAHILGRADG